jgi:hypothetical protein
VSSRRPTAKNLERGNYLLQMSATLAELTFNLVNVQKKYTPTPISKYHIIKVPNALKAKLHIFLISALNDQFLVSFTF